jgi:hypothetical protein
MSWLFKRRKIEFASGEKYSLREQKGVTIGREIAYEGYVPHPENIGKYMDFYRQSAVVHASINALTDMIVGVGFYTDADDQAAKEAVDAYAEQVNLDGVLRVACMNMLIYGFSPVERYWQNGLLQLKPLPPRTVYVRMNERGEVEAYRQRTLGRIIDFTVDEIIWFAHNELPGNPYGISIIEPVATLLEYKRQILEDICRIVHRYASPLNIWITRGSADDLKNAVSERPPDEDIFVGHASKDDLEVKTLEMDPRGKYTDYLDKINEEIYESMQAPIMTYLRNATEASARVQLDVIRRHVDGVQRYLKRKIEKEIFRPVIEKMGLSEVPRLRWGKPSTGLEQITIRDIALLAQSYVITSKQAADLLRRMGLPIEEGGEGDSSPPRLFKDSEHICEEIRRRSR